jgi:hypothetical protein
VDRFLLLVKFTLRASFSHYPFSKESSPLYHLVEPGDIILTIDGIDCRATDAHTLAEWITKKPWVPEHVLEILGDADARSLCSSQYDELSEC